VRGRSGDEGPLDDEELRLVHYSALRLRRKLGVGTSLLGSELRECLIPDLHV